MLRDDGYRAGAMKFQSFAHGDLAEVSPPTEASDFVLPATSANCAFLTGRFGSARSMASCSNGARELATYCSTGANSMLGSARSRSSCSNGLPISRAEAEKATALRADARMRRFRAYS